MRLAIGSDHGGFELKRMLIRQLKALKHSVVDVGTFSPESCDYPLIGAEVAQRVSRKGVQRGILLCKSGAGMAIVANKFPSVRAAVCPSLKFAQHAREHNDANVLVLGAEGLPRARAKEIVKVWLATPFAGGRHARRIRQISEIEKKIRNPHITSSSRKRGSDSRFRGNDRRGLNCS